MRGEGWKGFLRGAKRIEWIALAAALAVAALIWASSGRSGQTAAATEQERRVAQVLSQVDNAGRVQVLIGEGEDAGVLVVAEGADDIGVALRLAQAVQTLLGVENSRIEVLKMQQGG